jgi:hypothetical protein
LIFIIDAVRFVALRLAGFHPYNVEYEDTLAVLSVWSDPCGFGKKW